MKAGITYSAFRVYCFSVSACSTYLYEYFCDRDEDSCITAGEAKECVLNDGRGREGGVKSPAPAVLRLAAYKVLCSPKLRRPA